MRIDIWSDIVCPFCYIGKRRLEKALEQFENKDEIEIHFHSFQLDPQLQPNPTEDYIQHLSNKKGIQLEQMQLMADRVTHLAKKEGVQFNLENAVPANTLKAHQMIHFAKSFNKGNEAKEILLKAFFTDELNIHNDDVLIEKMQSIGIPVEKTIEVLQSGSFLDEVESDFQQARDYQITGVPFFIFNNKYAMSGAQELKTFKDAINTSFQEHLNSKK